MRFLGNIEAKTDSKGRVFLPAIFRKAIENSNEEFLVMRKDIFQPCLVLYPQSVWNNQLDILRSQLNRWNHRHQQIFRQFVADAEVVIPDKNGRILIPKRYLTLANISQMVRFIGMDDTIEIWNGEKASQPFMDPETFSASIEDLIKPVTTIANEDISYTANLTTNKRSE